MFELTMPDLYWLFLFSHSKPFDTNDGIIANFVYLWENSCGSPGSYIFQLCQVHKYKLWRIQVGVRDAVFGKISCQIIGFLPKLRGSVLRLGNHEKITSKLKKRSFLIQNKLQ